MNQSVARASEWLYHGIWAVLVRWFRVPAEPPTLPVIGSEVIQSFRPAPGFLQYLKFQFWLVMVIVAIGPMIGWLAMLIGVPLVGAILTPFAIALITVPPLLAYVAIHLRYDTTWYVLSDRSLRVRRGIWVIQETTITFENIQNVTVNQGPLQRLFGIADVLVKTAGGGGGQPGHEGAAMMGGHHGLLEGIDNAPQIRDLIMSRLTRSTSAGLGDEAHHASIGHGTGFSAEHIAALREIREAIRQLARTV